MADNFKLLGQEIALSSDAANTVYGAKLVRLINVANTNVLLTQRDSSNNVLGSITLAAAGLDNSNLVLMKNVSDTLEAAANSSILATPIGYY